MKWKKLGKIFDPTNHNLNFDVDLFAQSPQTLVSEDFIRVYFSTRTTDEYKKFKSKIAFIDFNLDFSEIIRCSQEEVIALGELGCFDEHGIFPINILQNGSEIWAYTCGWSRRVSVSVETSTGLAISKNKGMTFEKYGNGPILTSSLKEPFLVGDSFVRFFNNMYHMWYIFGTKWINTGSIEAERIYKIGYAQSKDGIEWIKNEGIQIIDDAIGIEECQALPTVLYSNGLYHMYFCYRHSRDFRKNPAKAYRLGYAFSSDLINWTRNDDIKGIDIGEKGEWDHEMMCYPHLFSVNQRIYLLYNGNNFGKDGFGLAELTED